MTKFPKRGASGTDARDVIVIGAGPAGGILGGGLAERDFAVAIVESGLVGECSFYACMPSKALLRPAAALAEVRRVPGAAQAVAGAIDVEAALARQDQIMSGLDDAHQLPWLELLEKRDAELAQGRLEDRRMLAAA